jgi:hypothetical protein
MTQTAINVTIAQSLNSATVVTCNVGVNQVIAVQVPNSIFVSFRSLSADNAVFFFTASYAQSAINTNASLFSGLIRKDSNFANSMVCSDKGAGLNNGTSNATKSSTTFLSVTTQSFRTAIMMQ